jgi:3-hydroxymyristoyl/3-hydroxydecanoyl-(acyl carrier protein) dehydratase
MRFLFVSRIHDIQGQKIRGQVDFSAGEPWRREDSDGNCLISTSVISEAIGQLVSWMALRDNDFSGRPVFLFATSIDLGQSVPAPATIDLEAWITDRSEDSFIFSGTAKIGGKTIVEIKDCGGYFMPLADLEDPMVTRQRYGTLSTAGLSANPESPAFQFSSLVDVVTELVPDKSISTAKVFRQDEPFYPDHFPRFPVTPIVVINEMIAEATRRLVAENPATQGNIAPVAVQDLKIKSFLRPGDTAVVNVKITESTGDDFETVAEIMVNQKRILRGRYRYQRKK